MPPRALKRVQVVEEEVADFLAEIDGIRPKVLLDDGETRTSASASGPGRTYTQKRTGDHYWCSCPAWRMAGGAPDARTCKHLKALLGDDYEVARIEVADPGSSKKVARAKKRKSSAEDEDQDEDEDERPVRKRTSRAKEVPTSTFKPLLAHKWDLDNGIDPSGWLMSEKLDGVRAVWHGDRGVFLSREGNQFFAPDWFAKKLPKNQMLDGELYTTRGGFQDTVSIVRAQNRPERWKFNISYQVFDVPSLIHQPFEQRLEWLRKKFSGRGSIRWVSVVEHEVCKSREHLFEKLDEVCELKGEGLMLREPGSMYTEGRSRSLLKVKRFLDADAVVKGYEEGKGKNTNVTGALNVEMLDDNGKPTGKCFKIGTGFSDAQRRNPPKIGTVVMYRYQELSNSGRPRFPSYIGERAD